VVESATHVTAVELMARSGHKEMDGNAVIQKADTARPIAF
jgi:hypothetical protein